MALATKARSVPPVLDCPVHGGAVKPCMVATSNAVHTLDLPEGHFAALVLDAPNLGIGAVAIMERAEVEALILLLRNAVEDAELLDAGKPAKHAAPTETRQ